VVQQLKNEDPTTRKVIVQSDNAGCYHSLELILRLGLAHNHMAIPVVGWLYSEAQDGKDVCDRTIGPLKQHLRNTAKQGGTLQNATQLQMALSRCTRFLYF
jgi:hypothetical protein